MTKPNKIEITKREQVILDLLSLGADVQSTGPALGVTGRTAESCVMELKKKLKAKNLHHLVAIALRMQLIK